MSDLFGAWSRTGAPLNTLLDASLCAQMCAQLPSPVRLRTDSTRLWLWAHPERYRCSDRGWDAMEGFLADPGLDGLPGTRLQGHYVAAHAPRGLDRVVLSRSLSGGERLYVAELGALVLFSASVRPLLCHPRLRGRLNRRVLGEVLLSGLPLFGAESLHEGIVEVLPGHTLVLSDRLHPQRWTNPDVLCSAEGDPDTLGRALRDRLTAAVAASAGPGRPVTVALSGGIDSSAVAVAAVDAFGADAVEAVTYEFDDPTHSTELDYARAVVQHLGIRQHHVFKLDTQAYLSAIPETIWRAEALTHWPKAFMLLVAREMRKRGRDRYLTGFGFGSHTAYLRELGTALSRHPSLGRILPRLWRSGRFGQSILPDLLAHLHPVLEVPHPRLYHLLSVMLAHDGFIEDVREMYPSRMHPLLAEVPDVAAREPMLHTHPPARRLQLQAFAHLISCIDVTRSEKASRELGVFRISPGHFPSCIGHAYFPVLPAPRLWSEARSLRPGKLLLRQGFQDSLPKSVVYRKKSWGDAVASDAWLSQGRRLMLEALPSFPGDAERFGPGCGRALQWWEPRSILATGLAFRLWERIFIEMPPQTTPPTWSEIWNARPS